MASLAPSARFDFGRVVERTFQAVGQNLVVFLLLSALLTGIPSFIAGWLTMNYVIAMQSLATGGRGALAATLGSGFAMVGVASIITAIAASVLQAAIVYGTIAFLNGRRAELGECVSVGLRYWFWLILLAILTGLAELVGLVFFIVPGIMMMLAWIVAVPALVTERKDVFGAMSRSAELTRNHRWAILGLVLVYAIAAWVIQLAITSAATVFIVGNPIATRLLILQVVITPLLRILFGVVSAAGVASIYYELRSSKEGIGPEALAAVFD